MLMIWHKSPFLYANHYELARIVTANDFHYLFRMSDKIDSFKYFQSGRFRSSFIDDFFFMFVILLNAEAFGVAGQIIFHFDGYFHIHLQPSQTQKANGKNFSISTWTIVLQPGPI